LSIAAAAYYKSYAAQGICDRQLRLNALKRISTNESERSILALVDAAPSVPAQGNIGSTERTWSPRGGDEMGQRIRAFNWAQTPVGPLAGWPSNLRVAVELCLNSRFPMFVWWGPDLINIYNDAYAPMMGTRHPDGLGASARVLWREAWSEIGPQTDAVLLRAQSTWNERRMLILQRNGYPEECYFTWSYSPILDETGQAAGIFCSVTEETGRVLAERERDQLAQRYQLHSRRFEKMLDSLTDLAFVFDLQGRFLYANRRLLEIRSMTLDQLVGKNFFDSGYPIDLATKLQNQIQQVIRTRQPVMDETSFTDRRGYTGYYQYVYSPVMDADGNVEAVAGVTRELTERLRLEQERKKLAEAVERERANLASIIEQSPSFIAVLRGPEHVYELVNEKYYEIAGRRNLIGRTVRQAFPDIAEQGFYELLDQVYQTGETFAADELPIFLTRPDGSLDNRYINLVHQALRDGQQQISGIFVHGVDVTDLVVSRQALKENEEFHRFAAEAGQTGSWKTDLATMETIFSPTMCQLLGLPMVRTTLAFEQWFKFVIPEHRAPMQAALDDTVQHGVPYDIEFQITRADGLLCWLASRGGVIRDASGKAIGLHGATVDITDKRKMAEERERLLQSERAARADAEHASLAKDKFLAILSHELRTPLSPVVMTIPAIESDPELPPRFRNDLAMVRRNIELEVKLIDDLLDLSRITSGKLRLQMQSVHVHELLLHMIHSSHADVVAKQLQVIQQFEATNDRLRGDATRLQQVFWNLLRNAIKFTPDHQQIIIRSFNVTDPAGKSRLVVEILDTGVGIAPEILPRVFDAFEQGDTRTTRQFGGLGLGLAISKAVVEMHGGSISASSGGHLQGSAFRVELTVETQTTTSPPPAPVTPLLDRKTAAMSTVLLVEDHADTSRTMARLLKNAGFSVAVAQSVTTALALLDTQQFDVMVSDIGLPDATGYELIRQAKARHQIPAIALSGYGMEEDIRKSKEAGFSEHLVKPVNISQLLDLLRRMTETPANPTQA
jgi:PAS domain S-box-containing protein